MNSDRNNKDQKMLDLTPALFFRYQYDRLKEKLEFTYIHHNQRFKEIFKESFTSDAHDVSDILFIENSQQLHAALSNAQQKLWQSDVEIPVSTGLPKWFEISGRHEVENDLFFEGYGFMHQASEKVLTLQESENKLESLNKLHHLILQFSSTLAQAKLDEVDSAVQETLFALGNYAEVDRVYIFEHEAEQDVVNNTFEWCANNVSPEIENLQGIPFDFVPRWKQHFTRREHIYIPKVAELGPDRELEREILEPQGIISLLAIPMFYGDKFYGFIGFDAVKKQRKWSDEHISLLRLAGEIISGTINRAKHETEITLARVKAEQANKAKSDFLATMSHEIRTPMNAILGFTEIVLNTSSNEKHLNYLNAVLASGKTLLSLINDILDLSKIEAGQMDINEEAVNIRIVFNEILEVFQSRIQEKNLQIMLDMDEHLPETLLLDDVRLRQVLFNLVGNAVKFTDKGQISIGVHKEASEISPKLINLKITIADTGIGISKEMLPRVFDSFFQIESDNTRKYGGTGLGLSISRRLVEIMGGEIIVESEPQQGTCFTITLRSIEQASGAPTEERKFDWNAKAVTFYDSKVLVVDDVDFNRELVKSYLSDYNFQLFEACNGKEGVETCKSILPDLVLMDLRMPEMNGYEATQMLRKDEKTSHIPIVAFTASSMKHDDKLIRELFHEYLRKPIGRNELVHCLAKFLPHSIDETKNVHVQEASAVQDYTEEQIHGFYKAFEHEQQAVLEELKTYFDTDLLTQFIKGMEHICRQFAISSMLPMLHELDQAKEQMDFANFEKQIAKIDAMIQDIRNTINNQIT